MRPVPPESEFVLDLTVSLRGYCKGVMDKSGLERLIEISATIVRQKLGGKLYAAAKAQETSSEEQALSIIAPLFGSAGPDSHLARALTRFLECSDIELFRHFQAVVVRSASQELFHRWDEIDAAGARLWRRLRWELRQDTRLMVFPAAKPAWVTLNIKPESNADLTKIQVTGVADRLNRSGESKNAMAEAVVACLKCADLPSDTKPAMSIDELFVTIRENLNSSISMQLVSNESANPPDPLLSIAIEKATEKAQKDTMKKLERYRASKKLPVEILGLIAKALDDLLEDCSGGGPAQSNFKYLSKHWPELAWEDYRATYRAKFEYLAESAQEVFNRVFLENYQA